MQSMPKQTVVAAGGVLILAAAVGIYLGVSRSLTASVGGADDSATIVPAVTPVASAKPILTPTPTMDEAEVRRLAREEAQALLSKPPAKKALVDADDDAESNKGEDLTPVTPSAAPSAIKPSSAPQG
jgi:hypothetical protein